MADASQTGLTLSPSSYSKVTTVVRDWYRTNRSPRPGRQRAPVFQPSAGGKIYQCVYGSRLWPGSVAQPDANVFEPKAICVQLGTNAGDELISLSNQAVLDLSILVGIKIVGSDGRFDPDAFESFRNSDQVKEFTSELPDSAGLTALRVRSCAGYVGTGSIVCGNDTEAWTSSGGNMFTATLQAAWTNGLTHVVAQIVSNQGAYDAGIATLIYDTVAVVNPDLSAIFLPTNSQVLVEFPQQTFFADDDAWSGADADLATKRLFWIHDTTYGYLPVFFLVKTPAVIPIVDGSGETLIPAYGVCLTKTGSDLTTGRVSVKRPDTYGSQNNALINGPTAVAVSGNGFAQGGNGPFIAAYDSSDGSPGHGEAWGPRSGTYLLKKNTGGFRVIAVLDATNALALVQRDPMLTFRGKTDASLSKGASGTISIYAGTLGSETDTTINMTAYNRFATVAITKWVTCSYCFDNQGWDLISAEC